MNPEGPKPWWERWPGRDQRELDAFADRDLDLQVDEQAKADGRLILRGTVPAGRLGDIEIVVAYPGTFPHTRPTVYQVTGPLLDRHQNPIRGNFCLIGRSSDEWSPSMTAADLVAKIPTLVGLVDEGGQTLREAEDPQGEPTTTYYDYPLYGGVLVPAEALQLPDGAYTGGITVQFRDCTWVEQLLTGSDVSHFSPALLAEVTDSDGQVLASVDPRLQRLFDGPVWEGRWVRVDQFPPTDDPQEFLDKLADTDPRVLNPGGYRNGGHHFGIHAAVSDEEIRQGEHGIGWVFAATAARAIHSRRPNNASVLRGMRYSRDHLAERIPELAALRDKTVVVVGLGALGAPIVRQLAQSQTGHLRLIDPDFIDPATTVRWPGGVQAAGIHKGLYLISEIQFNHPFVDASTQSLHVGQAPLDPSEKQQDDYTILYRQLQDADLVIDATAEDNVSLAISEIADELGVPQIYVYGVDGYGGLVARVSPGRSGCLYCKLLHLSPKHGDITGPPSAPEDQVTRVQPPGCDEPTFTAAATELLPLANQATRMAYAVLTEDTDSAYGDVDAGICVLALRNEDGQMLPAPVWETYPLEVHPDCRAH